MKYEIVIKEKTTETKKTRGDWEVVEKRPYTQEELDEGCKEYREAEKSDFLKRVYGYAPDKEVEKEIEQEIYRQEVENLDLVAVIKAINQIKEVSK